ncbi:phosphotransferase family protein [Sphaerimonospora mesophila]|uniref:phosphotransferase family protein n=1 Tax=Sphaerimonospora mesophila TaxID=37483 RepID=UPI0006E3D5E3
MRAPGLDLDRLGAWFAASVPGAGADLTARVITGGRSNLTYEISDGSHVWILRRPPLGHVLATAHDMAREYRVMTALRDTDVPVPATFALCRDTEVVGAEFYVMQRVAGVPYRQADELEALGPDRTRAISTRMVDVLATLHAVEPGAVGLTGFGRPDGFLRRQVSRWKRQLDASYSRELPAADRLHAALADRVPAESAAAIVHGDYRLDNLLIDEHDRPAAVIDWEMATLGDPLTDLALLVTYQRLGELSPDNAVVNATTAPGFLSETEMVERYVAHTGGDLPRFGFYLGLAAYKLAGILEGIHFRHLRGQTVGAGFDRIGEVVEPLLEHGLGSLKEDH